MAALALALLVVVAFLPALDNGFTNWDDPQYVTENPRVQHPTWRNLVALVTEPLGASWVPLTLLSFALEHRLVGLAPFLYHLDNVLLHALDALLVLWLLRRVGLAPGAAWLAAAAWAVHPLRVESVAWITERKDVLYAAFYLAALVRYTSFLTRGAPRARVLREVAALHVLALLAKVQAVTLPLSLLVLDLHLRRPRSRWWIWRWIAEKTPLLSMSLAVGAGTTWLLAERGSLWLEVGTLGVVDKLVLGAHTFVADLARIAWPADLSAFHLYPARLGPQHWASLVALAGLVAACCLRGELGRHLRFGLLFYAVNLVFVLQVLSAGYGYQGERFTYLAAIGPCYLLGRLAEWAFARFGKLAVVALLVYVVALGAVTWQRCEVWRDSETLWTDVLRREPAAVAYLNRGQHRHEQGRFADAEADYRAALALEPSALAYNNLGRLALDRGDLDAARQAFDRSLALGPTAPAYRNRATVEVREGRLHAALADLDAALALEPSWLPALRDRLVVRRELGLVEPALADAERCLELDPDDPGLHNDRGLLLHRSRRFGEAVRAYTAAIELAPDRGLYFLNRSFAHFGAGELAPARRDAERAAELGQPPPPGYIEQLHR